MVRQLSGQWKSTCHTYLPDSLILAPKTNVKYEDKNDPMKLSSDTHMHTMACRVPPPLDTLTVIIDLSSRSKISCYKPVILLTQHIFSDEKGDLVPTPTQKFRRQ